MIDASKRFDIEGLSGALIDMKITYSLNQNLDGMIAITKVNGKSNHPDGENYIFNKMEDFSHLRFELKYFY